MIPDLCTQNLDVSGIKTEITAMFKHIKYFLLYMEQYGNYITLNQYIIKDLQKAMIKGSFLRTDISGTRTKMHCNKNKFLRLHDPSFLRWSPHLHVPICDKLRKCLINWTEFTYLTYIHLVPTF